MEISIHKFVDAIKSQNTETVKWGMKRRRQRGERKKSKRRRRKNIYKIYKI